MSLVKFFSDFESKFLTFELLTNEFSFTFPSFKFPFVVNFFYVLTHFLKVFFAKLQVILTFVLEALSFLP